jgi:GGDEF domain-containing protein
MHSLGVLAIEWDCPPGAADLARALTDATRGAVRVTDLMFRHGDTQLVVLIPDCDTATGQIVSERVTVSALDALGHRGASVWIGFACAPADGDTLSELVQAAQSRLRRQRTGGAPLSIVPASGGPDDMPGPRAIPA